MYTIKRRKTILFILTWLITAGLVFSTLTGMVIVVRSEDIYALPDLPDVIENYEYNPVSIENVEFEYKWGGNPDHSMINKGTVGFYGYDSTPFFDAVFTNKYKANIFEFDVISNVDSGCISSTGFWINSTISDDGRITGYMIVIETPDLQNPSETHTGTKFSLFYAKDMDICTYNESVRNTVDNIVNDDIEIDYLKDSDIDADNSADEPEGDLLRRLTADCILLETYDRYDAAFMDITQGLHFRIESSYTSFRVIVVFYDQNEITLFEREVSPDGAQGFGLFAQHGNQNYYNDNACVRYGNVSVKNTSAAQTTARVNFKLYGTETPVAQSETKNGFAGGEYRITPPEIEGYRYVDASRIILDPIEYEEDPESNVTNLFYVSEITAAFQNISPFAYGAGYVIEPPDGPDITEKFQIIQGYDAYVDSVYPNVAVITPDANNKFGSMWAKEPIDLNMPFKMEMYLHLGHSENPPNGNNVADGMTFTMHNWPKALTEKVGGRGEGLGVWPGRLANGSGDGGYLPNGLVIEFDTYQNTGSWSTVTDPVPSNNSNYAHCSVVIPGPFTTAYPLTSKEHINTFFFHPEQDWVKFELTWTPEIKNGILGGTLVYTFGGTTKTYGIPNVKAVFAKDSGVGLTDGTKVWWGFTGTTGGQTSLQAAAITRLPNQPLFTKTVAETSASGKDGEAVKVRDEITYEITYENTTGRTCDLTITDTLAADLEYVQAWDENGNPLTGYSFADRTIVWKVSNVKNDEIVTVSITVKVTKEAAEKVVNTAKAEWSFRDGGGSVEVYVENPIIQEETHPFYFNFYKIDAFTREPLGDAQFKLYLWEGEGAVPDSLIPENLTDSGWRLIDEQSSTLDTGLVLFENLSSGIYQLAETKPPPGYQLPIGQWRFEITADGDINVLPSTGEYPPPEISGEGTNEIPFSIGNMVQCRLPETGGVGDIRYRITGTVLLGIGLVLTMITMHHRRCRQKNVS